jgi:hypothetical protein
MATITTLYVEPVTADGDSAGEGYTVDVPMRAVMDWERLFGGRSLADLTKRGHLSAHEMYELSYVALKRAKRSVPDKFTDFVEENEVSSLQFAPTSAFTGAETQEADPEPDPTQVVPSTAP